MNPTTPHRFGEDIRSAGGLVAQQPGPHDPTEPGEPVQPGEPGEPTLPDQPPPAPVAQVPLPGTWPKVRL